MVMLWALVLPLGACGVWGGGEGKVGANAGINRGEAASAKAERQAVIGKHLSTRALFIKMKPEERCRAYQSMNRYEQADLLGQFDKQEIPYYFNGCNL